MNNDATHRSSANLAGAIAMDDPDRWAPKLDAILEEQRVCVDALDRLSQTQRSLIESGDSDGLLQVLAERQEMLDRFQRATEDFVPYRENWEQLIEHLPARRQRTFNDRVRDLAELIMTIAQRDGEDRTALEKRRNNVADELHSMSRAKSAMAAYSPRRGTKTTPRYQDREG